MLYFFLLGNPLSVAKKNFANNQYYQQFFVVVQRTNLMECREWSKSLLWVNTSKSILWVNTSKSILCVNTSKSLLCSVHKYKKKYTVRKHE